MEVKDMKVVSLLHGSDTKGLSKEEMESLDHKVVGLFLCDGDKINSVLMIIDAEQSPVSTTWSNFLDSTDFLSRSAKEFAKEVLGNPDLEPRFIAIGPLQADLWKKQLGLQNGADLDVQPILNKIKLNGLDRKESTPTLH